MKNNATTKTPHLRQRIAYFAAKIMAEDNVTDFAVAKRKAAKIVGASRTRDLPDNSAIEIALLEYRSLYMGKAHPELLKEMRLRALSLMQILEKFNPHIIGAVLGGYAGENSNIRLQLFVENEKELEIFLIDHGWAYETEACPVYVGEHQKSIPIYLFYYNDCEIRLSVYGYNDIRNKIKLAPEGNPIDRASAARLTALLQDAG